MANDSTPLSAGTEQRPLSPHDPTFNISKDIGENNTAEVPDEIAPPAEGGLSPTKTISATKRRGSA